MNGRETGPIQALPIVMFGLFAGFWSTTALLRDMDLAVIPSVIVGVALAIGTWWHRRAREPEA